LIEKLEDKLGSLPAASSTESMIALAEDSLKKVRIKLEANMKEDSLFYRSPPAGSPCQSKSSPNLENYDEADVGIKTDLETFSQLEPLLGLRRQLTELSCDGHQLEQEVQFGNLDQAENYMGHLDAMLQEWETTIERLEKLKEKLLKE